jgi:DNA (cytosine-5)-methyltransferase 1
VILGVGTNRNYEPCWQCPDLPAPTIVTADAKPGGSSWILLDGRTDGRMSISKKPPFKPLTMAQVRAAPLTGLTHVSTFSGAGGTCLGFRMAGFRTLWANDIEDHARQCYSRNLESPIDGRDIRHLTAADILTATGLQAGELDVFEGSPPCTAFSTAGKLAKGWNKTKDHAGHVQTNVEDLFYEWLRLLEGLQPRAFVAENVAGMVRGVSKGYFKDVLRKMKALGYQVEARVLDAQWLGVPQVRRRVIFIGIRNDLNAAPVHPKPLAYQYSVRDALPWIAGNSSVIHDTSGTHSIGVLPAHAPAPAIVAHRAGTMFCQVQNGAFPKKYSSSSSSSPTIMAGRTTELKSETERRKFSIAELKRICSFPDDYEMTGSYAQQWARLGNSVPPLMAKAIAESVRDVLQTFDANVSV